MNVAELIRSIEIQLDDPARGPVSFSRDDAMSLLSRLTAFKKLVDKGEDKTPSQIAALMTQRAEVAERRARQMLDALYLIKQAIQPYTTPKPPLSPDLISDGTSD